MSYTSLRRTQYPILVRSVYHTELTLELFSKHLVSMVETTSKGLNKKKLLKCLRGW
jgi:hypothetical protein